ncbi:class Ib ribonucleoside-diphosphate reductase assembly flavoprotein NrdI [Streptobacillus felis]|uniref:Class Ib ribonucleoside-diphosphate reductase assembly flavoprotein NrdI n=1 Tax=Streptobacillus felis TaxID=1384509 RepID=A0A7Z0PFL0_9FUSO|nr:class Ib ribonucleoside-diphosphate reductase assembly flavoprotein NrdI [Streptobacillus felis]NYV28301.1 class Ib ribonucleoside-diphosphate reductase assembly flavoprotein NrdI [Streptobacillus felis]
MKSKIRIYYDSLTGNVERFIRKLKGKDELEFVKISSKTVLEKEGHLVTFTTGFGNIPKTTLEFLKNNDNYLKIKTVCSSGNMNWGSNFAKAGSLIQNQFNIKYIYRFELSGTLNDVEEYLNRIKIFESEGVKIDEVDLFK